MKILAVDTATKTCSVAVVNEDAALSEITLARDQTHSKHLMEAIHSAIRLSGLDFSDIDGFAVTKGPGSFTGLRIGISLVKGLAAASGKPVVGISTLDAISLPYSLSEGLICPLLDARKGEVYFSRYRSVSGCLIKELDEHVLPPKEAVEDISAPCLFIGDGAFVYKTLLIEQLGNLAKFPPAYRNTIHATSVAHFALQKFKNNTHENIASFVPQYIRRSDAEFKKPRPD